MLDVKCGQTLHCNCPRSLILSDADININRSQDGALLGSADCFSEPSQCHVVGTVKDGTSTEEDFHRQQTRDFTPVSQLNANI